MPAERHMNLFYAALSIFFTDDFKVQTDTDPFYEFNAAVEVRGVFLPTIFYPLSSRRH